MQEELKKYGDLLENVDLKKYNTYGIGGYSKYLLKPYDIKSLKETLDYLKNHDMPYYLLGKGSNIILPDEDFEGVIIRLDNLNRITFKENMVEVEAGCSLASLVSEALTLSYVNLSFAQNIPGTVGAAILGNAGCYHHEIFDYIKDITILDKDGNIKTLPKEKITYGYRTTNLGKEKNIVLKATFILEKGDVEEAKKEVQLNFQKRQATQPLNTKNAGSVFKNPPDVAAGKLIEDLNFKGYTIGGAKVSDKHANFIINYDNATSCDIINLITTIKKEVKAQKNIDLELEQIIVKWGNHERGNQS